MKKSSPNEGVLFHAGFPNAGEDVRGTTPLSLDKLIVQRRVSTFFWRLEEPVAEFGWKAGAIVVVDRSVSPRHGDKVVAIIENDFVVRWYEKPEAGARLKRPDGVLEAASQPAIWGVITWVLSAERVG